MMQQTVGYPDGLHTFCMFDNADPIELRQTVPSFRISSKARLTDNWVLNVGRELLVMARPLQMETSYKFLACTSATLSLASKMVNRRYDIIVSSTDDDAGN